MQSIEHQPSWIETRAARPRRARLDPDCVSQSRVGHPATARRRSVRLGMAHPPFHRSRTRRSRSRRRRTDIPTRCRSTCIRPAASGTKAISARSRCSRIASAFATCACRRIAEIVHDIDLKEDRYKSPHAATVAHLVEGLRASIPDDAKLLEQGIVMFEALYQSFQTDEARARRQGTHLLENSNRWRLDRGALSLYLGGRGSRRSCSTDVGCLRRPVAVPRHWYRSLTANPPSITSSAAGREHGRRLTARTTSARARASDATPRRTSAGRTREWRTSSPIPKVNPSVVLGDFSKPNPLVTFKLEDVAFVYGTKWKQRYFIRKGNDYYPANAQWDVTNRMWRPYFLQPNTEWWVQSLPGDGGRQQRPADRTALRRMPFDQLRRADEAGQPNGTSAASDATAPAASTSRGRARANIIDPSRLDYVSANDTCIQCHSQGQPLDESRSPARCTTGRSGSTWG